MEDEGNHLFLELTEEEFEDASEGNPVFKHFHTDDGIIFVGVSNRIIPPEDVPQRMREQTFAPVSVEKLSWDDVDNLDEVPTQFYGDGELVIHIISERVRKKLDEEVI